jgi:hypothetical protein
MIITWAQPVAKYVCSIGYGLWCAETLAGKLTNCPMSCHMANPPPPTEIAKDVLSVRWIGKAKAIQEKYLRVSNTFGELVTPTIQNLSSVVECGAQRCHRMPHIHSTNIHCSYTSYIIPWTERSHGPLRPTSTNWVNWIYSYIDRVTFIGLLRLRQSTSLLSLFLFYLTEHYLCALAGIYDFDHVLNKFSPNVWRHQQDLTNSFYLYRYVRYRRQNDHLHSNLPGIIGTRPSNLTLPE